MHIIRTTEKKKGPICTRRICRQRIIIQEKYSENVNALQAFRLLPLLAMVAIFQKEMVKCFLKNMI